MPKIVIYIILLFAGLFINNSLTGQIKLGLLVYNGGGDWYANPTSLKNLAKFTNTALGTKISTEEVQVAVGSAEIFNLPFIHATGHGRIFFTDQEAKNLRLYLEAGGFLHIDDNYGMDAYVRSEMKKVFPELSFEEVPFSHPIYHQKFSFKNGLPKIHEHDGGPPKGYGLFLKGKLVCFYTFDCDLGDGWEDKEVHNNPEEVRTKALQMGSNILQYVFNHR